MRFGHYWPKDPSKEKIEHLHGYYADDGFVTTPYESPFLYSYSAVPILRFEPFSVSKAEAPDPVPWYSRTRSKDGREAEGGREDTIR